MTTSVYRVNYVHVLVALRVLNLRLEEQVNTLKETARRESTILHRGAFTFAHPDGTLGSRPYSFPPQMQPDVSAARDIQFSPAPQQQAFHVHEQPTCPSPRTQPISDQLRPHQLATTEHLRPPSSPRSVSSQMSGPSVEALLALFGYYRRSL